MGKKCASSIAVSGSHSIAKTYAAGVVGAALNHKPFRRGSCADADVAVIDGTKSPATFFFDEFLVGVSTKYSIQKMECWA